MWFVSIPNFDLRSSKTYFYKNDFMLSQLNLLKKGNSTESDTVQLKPFPEKWQKEMGYSTTCLFNHKQTLPMWECPMIKGGEGDIFTFCSRDCLHTTPSCAYHVHSSVLMESNRPYIIISQNKQAIRERESNKACMSPPCAIFR